MTNFFSKHLSLIASLLIFSFIFYIGCTTTETGKIESDELHVVQIDSFYFAVSKKNDTINLANTSAKLQKYEEESDDRIIYNSYDSLKNVLTKNVIKTEDLKYVFAKHTKMSYENISITAGIIIGAFLLAVFILVVIFKFPIGGPG